MREAASDGLEHCRHAHRVGVGAERFAYNAPMPHFTPIPPTKLAALNRASVQLWLPHASLSHCVRAVVVRSTLGIGRDWPEAWQYNYFPATPLCSFGWFIAGHSELIDAGCPAAPDSPAQRMPRAYFSGPFTRPTVSRNTPEGHGVMLLLLPDAVHALTGLNPGEWIDRFESLPAALGPQWQALSDAVLAAPDDATRVRLIGDFLSPRWQDARARTGAPTVMRLHDWARALAMRAAVSGVGRSLRQAERRVKGWTGLPMRELRGMGRAEQAFFRTVTDGEGAVNWADIAADTGYADQSHLSRETRRITGFPPGELRRRIVEDESFWVYRIWT